MKLSLCLLTWNELNGCKLVLPKIPKKEFAEIFCIDAGSNDGTQDYLRKKGIPVYQQPKKGLNVACVFAFTKCKQDALIFFHPKGSISPKELKKFKFYFKNGHDLVVASRNIPGGKNEEDDFFSSLESGLLWVWRVLLL